jgi:hypothetical protein
MFNLPSDVLDELISTRRSQQEQLIPQASLLEMHDPLRAVVPLSVPL